MAASGDFTRAAAALHGAGVGDDLCAPFLSVLPVMGVAISTVGNPFGSETVCASDATAARLDEIQLDLGEGPCWEAVRTRTPVLEPDVQAATSARWPVALQAMQETGLGAVFAFPMRLGTLDIGVVDLYTHARGSLGGRAVQEAIALTEAAARSALRRALLRVEVGADGDSHAAAGAYSRREVHQASGMLAAQTGTDADDALLILRGHAFVAGRSVRSLAADVVARVIDFTDRNDVAP
ncbi:GAF and ANTAR domain-containing protein [Curtobacterium sp. VKM Ac-1393]|uniref:GAF and ANTAR domain-containing protein n=1 Tax=Curtobacterium sp. VKM Ac-1393 TaxID=2783814 RepID=UPI00188D1225|nr:GAF and ANTAR domain-containing protein [Curtobacterium sp. VKM Ac-1393]MBF4609585.1 GAF and ANTAR domain-containing protein [Curtobacterium sp. VKM Ac-1393]